MKLFLLKTGIFSLFSVIGILSVFMFADGTTDEYYQRLITPKQNSMIIGTSRAANALRPDVFDEILTKSTENKFFNYSFNIFASSYSPVYYRSIKRKLNKNATDGFFILSVTPWNLSNRPGECDETLTFRENDDFLAGLWFVNMRPNFFYLIRSYQHSYLQIIENRLNPPLPYLHENGWLEIDLSERNRDYEEQLDIQIRTYEELLYKSSMSEVRLNYLKKTIELLNNHGKVILVRLPVHDSMFILEDIYSPHFDEIMQEISDQYDAHYLSYRNRENAYLFYDHEHIEASSAVDLSRDIANWIKNIDLNHE